MKRKPRKQSHWLLRMKDYIVQYPVARERKNKNRAIGNLITNSFGTRVNVAIDPANPDSSIQYCDFHLTREKLADMVGEILTADRAWRRIMQTNQELRGSDYREKKKLESQSRMDLGYRD